MATSLHKKFQEKYQRVGECIDIGLMVSTALYVVGTGASGALIESFGRLGVKRFVLFDPDIVEEKNLVAQNFTRRNIGKKKTEAISERLRDIEFEPNHRDVPELQIDAFGDFLGISDNELKTLIENDQAENRQVIFIMATDLHPAQARANRIALRHRVPVFWVGIYRAARAGEIVFFDPRKNVNPNQKLGCYRCLTASRYQWWDENMKDDYVSGITSGAGISGGLPMAAGVIDNILAHLVIGAIHVNDENNTQAKLYRRVCGDSQNLIQIQLDQNYAAPGDDPFAKIDGPQVVTFKTAFQIMPRMDNCIDCVGTPDGIAWGHTNYLKDYDLLCQSRPAVV
jgi:ThiF family